MKKLAIVILAALLVIAFVMPASALESIFGGYWRTRAFTNRDFTGDDSEARNLTQIDTRTRLYYTAVLNDNLKFVNKFEMDAVWGEGGKSYGDIGADGVAVEVKNSYIDFDIGPVNSKIGIQGMTLGRGFLFDDDCAGAVVSFKGDGITVPIIWIRPYDDGRGTDENAVDFFGVAPVFSAKGASINPFFLYARADHVNVWDPTTHNVIEDNAEYGYGKVLKLTEYDKMDVYYAGLDVEANVNMASIWLTGIYQGGSVRNKGSEQDTDIKAWLAAAGLSFDMGAADVHGQAFYATGQGKDTNDIESFFVPSQNDWTGQCYYWSEIMGYGIFDEQVSAGSPADKISNILAANVGTTIKPMSDLKISLDAWYAKLAEKIYVKDGDVVDANTPGATEADELGIEANVTITYTLLEGLNLDVVGAYLFAGDATTRKSSNDKNPYEIGTRLSLSF